MSTEKLVGKVASYQHKSTSPKGWEKWDVAFEDGSTQVVILPPDRDFEFSAGVEIECKPSKFGNDWLIDLRATGGGGGGGSYSKPSSNGSSNGSSAGSTPQQGSSGSWRADDYWQSKFHWEVETREKRDFQVDRKNILSDVISTYVTALEAFPEKSKPKSVDAVNILLDECFAKATELTMRLHSATLAAPPVKEEEPVAETVA